MELIKVLMLKLRILNHSIHIQWTKLNGENLCTMYNNLFGLKTTILRYFNVFRTKTTCSWAVCSRNRYLQSQKLNGEPLTIVGDGSQRRDFVYVKDVARANYLAAISEHPLTEVYNVGTGKNYSVKEIAGAISNSHTNIPEREGEMQLTLANIDKIEKHLGWKPEVDVMDWYLGELYG